MTQWFPTEDIFWPFPGQYTVARDIQDERQYSMHSYKTKEEAQRWADHLNSKE